MLHSDETMIILNNTYQLITPCYTALYLVKKYFILYYSREINQIVTR